MPQCLSSCNATANTLYYGLSSLHCAQSQNAAKGTQLANQVLRACPTLQRGFFCVHSGYSLSARLGSLPGGGSWFPRTKMEREMVRLSLNYQQRRKAMFLTCPPFPPLLLVVAVTQDLGSGFVPSSHLQFREAPCGSGRVYLRSLCSHSGDTSAYSTKTPSVQLLASVPLQRA